MNGTNKDIDPASELREEDEESSLPELDLESASIGTLAGGRAAITRFAKLAPSVFMGSGFARSAPRNDNKRAGHELFRLPARQPRRATKIAILRS